MKPVIGIIYRNSKSLTNKLINIVYEDLNNSVIKSGGIPIGISIDNIYLYLNICKGFILQGGDEPDTNIINFLKTINNNIPILGICLGMQEMNLSNSGTLTDIANHQNNIYHEIYINPKSKLYKIIKKDKILVNSRHKSSVKNTNLMISSISKDNIIESIEDPSKKFFIGLQWHPENLYDNDVFSKNIFDYFIKVCQDIK